MEKFKNYNKIKGGGGNEHSNDDKKELSLTNKIIIGVCVPVGVIVCIIIIFIILNSIKSVANTGTSGVAQATNDAIKIGAAYGVHWLFGGEYIQKVADFFHGTGRPKVAGKVAEGAKAVTEGGGVVTDVAEAAIKVATIV
jgi:hypothetical protein